MDNSLTLSIGAASDPGLVRWENEDALGYHVPDDPNLRRARGALFVVCDGIGGLHAGGYASRLAVDTFIKTYYEGLDRSPRTLLHEAAILSNKAIYRSSQNRGRGNRMGTTIVAAVIQGTRLWVLNVGDSRVYLWRQGMLHQLSRDHTPAARRKPEDRRIDRALGTDPEVEPFQSGPILLAPGDSVLLCTDGLTTAVPMVQIAHTIGEFPAPQAVRQLIEQAKTAGAQDNITLLLINLITRAQLTAEQVRTPGQANPGNLWAAIRKLNWIDVDPSRLLSNHRWRTTDGAAILLAWLVLALIAGLLLGWLLSK